MKRLGILTVAAMTLVACHSELANTTSQRSRVGVVDRGYDYAIDGDVSSGSGTVVHNKRGPSSMTLADMIRQTSGVNVMGNGAEARIRVRGVSSMQGSDPLFVINGTAVGNDFRHVFSLVNPNDVQAITVLKGSDAAIYGSRGGFGVVVIRTI